MSSRRRLWGRGKSTAPMLPVGGARPLSSLFMPPQGSLRFSCVQILICLREVKGLRLIVTGMDRRLFKSVEE